MPLQSQLRELVASYEEGLGDMKVQNSSQKKGALPKATGQSSTSPNNNHAAAEVTTEAASGEMASGGLSLDIPATDDAARNLADKYQLKFRLSSTSALNRTLKPSQIEDDVHLIYPNELKS